MSHTNNAWTVSTQQTYTIAGTNATIPEMLLGIKNAITAVATQWVVSDFNSGNGTLEIKRGGSPSGELASVRILLFGGTTPNAAALIPVGLTAVSTAIYGSLCIDASTTGPSASYTSAAPYSGTKYLQGGRIVTSSDMASAQSARITIFENAVTFGVCLSSNANIGTYVGGQAYILASDDSERWMSMPSGSAFAVGAAANVAAGGAPFAIPAYNDGSATEPKPCFYDGTSVKQFGSVMIPANSVMDLGEDALPGCFIPVATCAGAQANSTVEIFSGQLRQLRYGPKALHRTQFKNGSNVLQAQHIHGGTAAGHGMWLTEAL